MIREPAVAGVFYPSSKKELSDMLSSFFRGASLQGGKATHDSGVVVAPHAGIAHSGKIAAFAYNALKKADTYFILSPNHTGLGEPISIYPEGGWKTPLGEAGVDEGLASALAKKLGIGRDEIAHIREHSIEVQLPFLQHVFGKVKIVPVTLGGVGLEEMEKLGKAIAEVSNNQDVAVIASSDFTHGLPEASARKKDREAVGLIEKMDIRGFDRLVQGENLSICGYLGIEAAMAYALERGFKAGKLLNYGNSGSTTLNRAEVVGYAAVSFF